MYQGGLFGLSGMMPPRYTQALMTGQGIGGIFACVADIGSKLGTKTTFTVDIDLRLLISLAQYELETEHLSI